MRAGRLTLAANELTCLYLLPLLHELPAPLPDVHVTVQRALASRIPGQVLDFGADIGVVTFRPDLDLLTSIVVYRDELAFVVPPGHPYAKRASVSIAELAGESFVAHHVASPYRQKVIETFQDKRVQLQMPVEMPTIDAIKKFVAMGNGVALLPAIAVEGRARAQRAGARDSVPDLDFERKLRLVHRREASLSHAAQAFLAVVEAQAVLRKGRFCVHGRGASYTDVSCLRALRLKGRSRVATRAEVAELADALASGASPGNRVEVRVLSSAPNISHETNRGLR